MALRSDSALALLRRARDADPSFLPAEYRYVEIRWRRSDYVRVRREYAHPDPRGGSVTECLALATAGRTTGEHPPDSAAFAGLTRLARRDSSGCSLTYIALMSGWSNAGDTARVSSAEAAWRAAPALSANWLRLSAALAASGRLPEAIRVDQEALTRPWPATALGELYPRAIDDLLSAGDTSSATYLALPFADAEFRDGRPLARVWGCAALKTVRLPLPPSCGLWMAMPASTADWESRLNQIEVRGEVLLDGGLATRAMTTLDSGVVLADSAGWPGPRMRLYTRRGRAESKAGVPERAVRDLLLATALDSLVDDQYWAEAAWHQLAHSYEEQGAWGQAVKAIDRYVALSAGARWSDDRAVARYDAGLIRWEAGWHASADTQFAAMVGVIDDQGTNQYWAGEYFERTGALDRARHYYGEAVRTHHGPGQWYSQALAGLTRIFEALGQSDSAEHAAAQHDSAQLDWVPLDAPLLPAFIARHGHPEEGVRLAERWSTLQAAAGNVQGGALAYNEAAELALRAGDPAAALTDAITAESLAHTIHAVAAGVEASALRGQALLALGRSGEGLAALRTATLTAEAHPLNSEQLNTSLAFARALERMGETRDALSEYARAARAAEHVTAALFEDFDRTRYRAVHLAPFNEAIRLLLASRSPRDVDQILRWSQRRKAVSLAVALAGHDVQRRIPAPLPLLTLRARLSRGEALLDYIVLDSSVTAVVLTNRGSQVTKLPISPEALALAVARLRRPFDHPYAGSVDMARAPYDLDLASHLYQSLVSPLLPALAGITRLAIAADGPLHALPFGALVAALPTSGGYRDTAYLLDRYEIRYLPSAQFLAHDHGAPLATALAVFTDAPGALQEDQALRSVFGPQRLRVLEGTAATETEVRASAPRYDILHLAVHAVANIGDPLASHLRLVPDSANDGFWQLSEIMEERWHLQIVVLSACETMSGPESGGEGMIGLARAFLASGARNVVATQWPVGAPTADLMGTFYRGVALGETPSEALRVAQLRLRHLPNTGNPFFWAAFEVVRGR
ncbi:MAG TPA: CHAT domain-containing protein [Gemmatimonadales bacterium]|nr:CHAT domain-containing protein [Gemmatimonadales bacterium]